MCIFVQYAIVIALFAIAEAGATIYFAIEQDKILDDIRDKLEEEIPASEAGASEEFKEMLRKLRKEVS